MSAVQRFSLKTEIVFGPSILDRLGAFRGQRVGIITDAFMAKSGAVERIRAKLPECQVQVFSEVVPEPPMALIVKGALAMAGFGPQVIVALGGGSSIDAAKAIMVTLREMAPGAALTLVAVPTTSGTGSEVTSYAVITDPDKGLKYPLRSEEIVPDVALLDAELVRTVPAAITADTGLDVITHALEALVSREATDFSDAFAEKALDLSFANLPKAFANGDDMAARAAMHNASCMAGMAFNASGLGLCHGMAHAFGGRLHISHGRMNAMLLPLVIDYNAADPRAAARYADVAKRIGCGGPTAQAAAQGLARYISHLNDSLGIPATLRAMGKEGAAGSDVRQAMVEGALADSCTASNPRRPRPEDVAQLIRVLAGEEASNPR